MLLCLCIFLSFLHFKIFSSQVHWSENLAGFTKGNHGVLVQSFILLPFKTPFSQSAIRNRCLLSTYNSVQKQTSNRPLFFKQTKEEKSGTLLEKIDLCFQEKQTKFSFAEETSFILLLLLLQSRGFYCLHVTNLRQVLFSGKNI